MQHQPTRDRVLIQRGKMPEQSKGGIILPGSDKKKANYGTVLAVGPGDRNRDGEYMPMSVKPGDKVTFVDYTADREVGDDLVIADDEDILSIMAD